MDYKHLIVVVTMATMACGLHGCTSMQGVAGALGGASKLATAATDRIGAWAQVRVAETGVGVAIAKAREAEALAKVASANNADRVSVVLDSPEKIAVYKLAEANRSLASLGEGLVRVALALAPGKHGDGELMQYTPFVGGAFTEAFTAIGEAAKGILDTTPAGLLAGGIALDKVFNGRPAGNIFHGDVSAEESFNTNELHQTGSTGNPSMAPHVAEPVVVHADTVDPVIVEQPDPVIINNGGT
jgi:hypothetical protein